MFFPKKKLGCISHFFVSHVLFFIPGVCRRFAGSQKGYVDLPCPNIVLSYNSSMGGVDLVNECNKCYRVHVRLQKWYWAIYTWFLNAQMVQAWRLFRATVKSRNQQGLEEEKAANMVFEESLVGVRVLQQNAMRKEREEEMKRKRKEEKKREEISLLNFIREVVEITIDKHSDIHKDARQPGTRLSSTAQKVVRFDMKRPHLIVKTAVTGRCQQCGKRSLYRGVETSPKF